MDREAAGVVAVRLSELLGLDVHTESGDHVGRVFDVRGELTPRTLKVTGLVVGRRGLLERLGIGAATAPERLRSESLVVWKEVVRADRRGVVIRDGAEPR
jgi:sporulation protein YlmC with PRC-barrel domain